MPVANKSINHKHKSLRMAKRVIELLRADHYDKAIEILQQLSQQLQCDRAKTPPGDDFVSQHSRLLFTAIILILLASLVWFSRNLHRSRQQSSSMAHWRLLLGYVLVPLLIDAFIAWYILAKELPQSNTTVLLTLRLAPDIGLLTVLVLTLAIGWGALRTILASRAILIKPLPIR